MPPKSRTLVRKGSTASQPSGKDTVEASSSTQTLKDKSQPKTLTKMLPPPSPVCTTILGPEMRALEKSLKEAALNTGRIFRFYADTRKE